MKTVDYTLQEHLKTKKKAVGKCSQDRFIVQTLPRRTICFDWCSPLSLKDAILKSLVSELGKFALDLKKKKNSSFAILMFSERSENIIANDSETFNKFML